jgi:hypothetical protein
VELSGFRQRFRDHVFSMLEGIQEFDTRCRSFGGKRVRPELLEISAADLHRVSPFKDSSRKANLVVTSPPYPGVHVLYHRWQIGGGRESPAPYWIAGCEDGMGESFYNFGDRREPGLPSYFKASLDTLRSIRQVLAPGATVVQLLAFNRPRRDLPRYLRNMEQAGFSEVTISNRNRKRIWRDVPNRKWYADMLGKTSSAREVVLIHTLA